MANENKFRRLQCEQACDLKIAQGLSTAPKIYNVENIEDIPNEILNVVKAGDIVCENYIESNDRISHICSIVHKPEGQAHTIVFVSFPFDDGEVVSYEYGKLNGGDWEFISSYDYQILNYGQPLGTQLYKHTITTKDEDDLTSTYEVISRNSIPYTNFNAFGIDIVSDNFICVVQKLLSNGNTICGAIARRVGSVLMPCFIECIYNSGTTSLEWHYDLLSYQDFVSDQVIAL